MNLQTLVFCLLAPDFCLLLTGIQSLINGSKYFTSVEKPLQIRDKIQNKPKVKYAQNNISALLTSKYRMIGHLVIKKTNPIQSQSKPNSNPNKANFGPKIRGAKPIQTQTQIYPRWVLTCFPVGDSIGAKHKLYLTMIFHTDTIKAAQQSFVTILMRKGIKHVYKQ